MISENRVELLAPAGSLLGLKAAIHAGADAVYLGGSKFGARAYAQNFTDEELLEGISYAHLCGRKLYLTVNTLLKNAEICDLFAYMEPLVKAGLDGAIVQDLGVIAYLKEAFPSLHLHASTQMTITDVHGAKGLLEKGISRVVPARELSASEIKKIVDAGIEVESFIHGSMCYCYSGQCLFSSMLGDRSGNRGRCAQPCRLPYRPDNMGNEMYPLSMKDMCTVEDLPRILDCGIASLKIEGRMKNPSYGAGVTLIYRKYIDMYYKDRENYKVAEEDIQSLRQLYVRTSLQNGYYFNNKGRDMITINNPAYGNDDKSFSDFVTQNYVEKPLLIPVKAEAELIINQPMRMKLFLRYNGCEVSATAYGEIVQQAKTVPLSYDDVAERLKKTGGTLFTLESLELSLDENSFSTVKQLNTLRRTAIENLECEILKPFIRKDDFFPQELNTSQYFDSQTDIQEVKERFIVFVNTKEQFLTVSNEKRITKVAVAYGLLRNSDVKKMISDNANKYKQLFIVLPAVMRDKDYDLDFTKNIKFISDKTEGIYCNQIDQVFYLKENGYSGRILGNINLYYMNDYVANFWKDVVNSFTVSTELKYQEIKHLSLKNKEVIIYGYLPVMQTANCVALTVKRCIHHIGEDTFISMTDRCKVSFPVELHCSDKYCYNTVYNSVPISLHKQSQKLCEINAYAYQIRFTSEDSKEVKRVLKLYLDEFGIANEFEEFPYTNGHFIKGIL